MKSSVNDYDQWRVPLAEALACHVNTIPDGIEAMTPHDFDESKRQLL